MSQRAIELANRFPTANAELIGVIRGATDAELQRICPGEQWSVLVTARHVAISYRVVASWIRRVANGEEVSVTRQQIDEGNALHAQEFATTSREEVLTLLRDNGLKAADTIRNLSDEQLGTSAVMGPENGDRLTAQRVTQEVLINHVAEHTADIQAALARSVSGGA
jgi:DinB superfamily